MDPAVKNFLFGLGGGLIIALIGFGLSRIGHSRDNKSEEVLRKEALAIEAVKDRDKAIVELQREVAVMKAEAVPITAAFMASLQAKLKHFHTPKLDAKLAEMKPDVALSAKDADEVDKALKARAEDVDPLIDEEERIAARILLDVQRMAVIESEKRMEGSGKLETLLVSQPAQSDGEESEKKAQEADERNG